VEKSVEMGISVKFFEIFPDSLITVEKFSPLKMIQA